MLENKFNVLIGVLLLVIGIVLLSIGLTLIPLIYKVLLGTSFVFGHYGEQSVFSSTVNGILAGGYIMILPEWKIRVISIAGVLSLFLGMFFIINREVNSPIKQFFSREYWLEFSPTFKLHKDIVSKRTKK
jgi:hypothetical protein